MTIEGKSITVYSEEINLGITFEDKIPELGITCLDGYNLVILGYVTNYGPLVAWLWFAQKIWNISGHFNSITFPENSGENENDEEIKWNFSCICNPDLYRSPKLYLADSLIFPEGCTRIGENFLHNTEQNPFIFECKNLIIPGTVKEIGKNAFFDLMVPEENITYGNLACPPLEVTCHFKKTRSFYYQKVKDYFPSRLFVWDKIPYDELRFLEQIHDYIHPIECNSPMESLYCYLFFERKFKKLKYQKLRMDGEINASKEMMENLPTRKLLPDFLPSFRNILKKYSSVLSDIKTILILTGQNRVPCLSKRCYDLTGNDVFYKRFKIWCDTFWRDRIEDILENCDSNQAITARLRSTKSLMKKYESEMNWTKADGYKLLFTEKSWSLSAPPEGFDRGITFEDTARGIEYVFQKSQAAKIPDFLKRLRLEYMDDVIVFEKTYREWEEQLKEEFDLPDYPKINP